MRTASGAQDRPLRTVRGYSEHAPPAALSGVLDAVWLYATDDEPGGGAYHRVLPEPGVSLSFRCMRAADGRVLHGTLSVQGPLRDTHVFRPEPGLRVESVRIQPEWCRAILGAKPDEIAGICIGWSELAGPGGARLMEQLMRTHSGAQAALVLLTEVHARFSQRTSPRDLRLAHHAAVALRSGPATLRAIAARLGISERHLRRVVRDATGIGAKHLQRVHRLNRAVAIADRSERPAWARIAARAGYYDQSHLIDEFLAFTRCTPSVLHLERRRGPVSPIRPVAS